MKALFTLFFILIFCIAKAQVVSSLNIPDTRYDNSPPTFYNYEFKVEFKARNVIGVPGAGYYSALMTIAPWTDNSGNNHHQIDFNNGGIYYRTGKPEDSNWGTWSKILTSSDNIALDGTLSLLSTGANKTIYISGKTNGNSYFNGGNVLIGKTSQTNSSYKLDVNGDVRANKVVVNTTGADYVFDSTYQLPSLDSLKHYLKIKHHLPGIASAKKMQENGLDVGANQTKLLSKIEELSLYTIQQNQQLKTQNKIIAKQQKEIDELKKQFKEVLSKLKKSENLNSKSK